ncbi:MAG TPA: helix-turn-helix transcriptional regulator [Candidatus Limnocylindrales bacterium]|nr:helix-turn-helix transcriptional regulator [Candidatus Limnocylindrales bacterium]
MVATRLGTALRDARLAAGMSQQEAAARAGLSQPRYSELERELGANASLETWALAAAGVGEQLVGFLERAPGANPPRDIEHLRRQAVLIAFAEPGGWEALPELALDPGSPRSRSVDVALVRWDRHEAILAEIWDWFDDVGASLRSLDSKRDAFAERLRREHDGGWTVRCLFVLRGTKRNEALVAELRPLFAARFKGSSIAWLRALADPKGRPPERDGLLWSTATYRLIASRLRTQGS